MLDFIFLLEVVVVFSISFSIFYFLSSKIVAKIKKKDGVISKKENILDYLKMGDSNAQMQYKKSNDKSINLPKNIIEDLSWDFLYRITEIILSKFSADDKKEIENLGMKLLENGMAYQHDFRLGISTKELKSKELEIKKSKNKENTLSI